MNFLVFVIFFFLPLSLFLPSLSLSLPCLSLSFSPLSFSLYLWFTLCGSLSLSLSLSLYCTCLSFYLFSLSLFNSCPSLSFSLYHICLALSLSFSPIPVSLFLPPLSFFLSLSNPGLSPFLSPTHGLLLSVSLPPCLCFYLFLSLFISHYCLSSFSIPSLSLFFSICGSLSAAFYFSFSPAPVSLFIFFLSLYHPCLSSYLSLSHPESLFIFLSPIPVSLLFSHSCLSPSSLSLSLFLSLFLSPTPVSSLTHSCLSVAHLTN